MELGQKEVSAAAGRERPTTRWGNEKNLQQFQPESPAQGGLDIRSPRSEHRKRPGVKVVMYRQQDRDRGIHDQNRIGVKFEVFRGDVENIVGGQVCNGPESTS